MLQKSGRGGRSLIKFGFIEMWVLGVFSERTEQEEGGRKTFYT